MELNKWQSAQLLLTCLLMYQDEFMVDPNDYRIMVHKDIQLQCHLLQIYHDSSVGMHCRRKVTYGSLSYDFYW